MNCFSINLQGVGCVVKRSWIRSLCYLHKVNFLAIQETKLEDINLSLMRYFWGNLSFMHSFSPPGGASGGILAIWDLSYISHKRVISTNWYVVVDAVWQNSGLNVLFIVVYTPQGANCKQHIWYDISKKISSFDEECIIIGEFNEVWDKIE